MKEVEDYGNSWWVCPYCDHENELEFWPSEVYCEKCNKGQEFDTDYCGDSEDLSIVVNYIRPIK